MESYEYRPLADNTVRMLTLFAGSSDEPLAGSLVDFDMKLAPSKSYEPVSYVWGDPNRTHAFTCDGRTLKLTSSLYHALRRLRLSDKDRYLWADQICIDQGNTIERAGQVKFMNAIYKRADQVLVWLGSDANGEAEAAFRLIRSLADTFADNGRYESFRAGHTGENLADRSEEDWVPIKHLTSLPWVGAP